MKGLNIKGSFKSGSFKKGTYSAGLSAMVIAVVIVINLVAGQLPESVRSIDMSSQKYYTIGDSTKKILKNLKDDITIYQMTKNGNEDSRIKKLLETYKSGSDKIKVETLDPDLQPGVVTKYEATQAADNSLIVVNGDRHKLIDYSEIYVQDYSQYYTTGATSSSFDGEGRITSAINYVTTDNLPKMYTLSGHSEQQLSQTITDAVAKQNISTEELNLLASQSGVPEDCDILAIICPGTDCSEEEAESIISYLEAGGKALIVMNYQGKEQPNFNKVLEAYGVRLQDGYVIENNQNYYYQYGFYLLPEVKQHDITSSFYGKMYVMTPMSQGIVKLSETRSTLQIEDLITTTEDSYADVDYGESSAQDGNYAKAEDDVDGPFSLAVAITEPVDDKETKLAVYGSYLMFTENITNSFSLGNVEMFTNSLSWMCGETGNIVAIEAKSMDVQQNTIATSKSNLWTAVFVAIIPLVVIITGFVVWYRRRRA
ncbi:MAG: GldG family protein [Lachnospiraceae bacterium]|nr:GldG family protein [Lachnospiraceae bacterium]MDE6253472.1 GldG family protein [Lachnospiraceae bacterium]